MLLQLQTRSLDPTEAASLQSWLQSPQSLLFRQLLQTQCLLAQFEAGQEATKCANLPAEVMAAALKEHVEAADRFERMLDYMDSLKSGKVEPKLLVNASPESLPT